MTDTHTLSEADSPLPDWDDALSDEPWMKRDEEHYWEWNAHQLCEQLRTGGRHCDQA